MREGLSVRISAQPDMLICGEAASAHEALAKAHATHPHLMTVDIALADSHGLDLINETRARFPGVRMLVVSAYPDCQFAERALRAGAHGYVNKQQCQDQVVSAIRAVMRGQRYLSQEVTQHLVEAVGRGYVTAEDPVQRLSNREMQVFQLIGQGKSTGSIARSLHLSVHTIETHREKIRHKLGIGSGTELARVAIEYSLIH
jgi:DNA-binding NarL/FixJ family response regulator